MSRSSNNTLWLLSIQKQQYMYFQIDYLFSIIICLSIISHPRSTVVLLDTETPGTSRQIYSEDADDGTRTHNPKVIMRKNENY